LGADGAPCNNNLDVLQELRLAALLSKTTAGPQSMPARTALELATIRGARVLGLEEEIGSLQIGKRADVVVMDLRRPHALPIGDPYGVIVYASRAADVRH